MPRQDDVHVALLDFVKQALVSGTGTAAVGRDVVVLVDRDNIPTALGGNGFTVKALAGNAKTGTDPVLRDAAIDDGSGHPSILVQLVMVCIDGPVHASDAWDRDGEKVVTCEERGEGNGGLIGHRRGRLELVPLNETGAWSAVWVVRSSRRDWLCTPFLSLLHIPTL